MCTRGGQKGKTSKKEEKNDISPASHGHAARAHCAMVANWIGRLFHKTADPRTNFVKEHVFGVKDGAPILAQDHPVMKQVAHRRASAFICLNALLVDSLLAAFANGNDLVLFNMQKSDITGLEIAQKSIRRHS